MLENNNNDLSKDIDMENLKKQLRESYARYNNTIKYMVGDAPIASLCLSKNVEKVLRDNGFLRIYDIFDVDLTKIEGLHAAGARDLTASLNKFLAML